MIASTLLFGTSEQAEEALSTFFQIMAIENQMSMNLALHKIEMDRIEWEHKCKMWEMERNYQESLINLYCHDSI